VEAHVRLVLVINVAPVRSRPFAYYASTAASRSSATRGCLKSPIRLLLQTSLGA
jgi:hypothetical protein